MLHASIVYYARVMWSLFFFELDTSCMNTCTAVTLIVRDGVWLFINPTYIRLVNSTDTA